MRVVFDTNIYISAFVIPGGNAEKAYLAALGGHFSLYTSVAILTETAGKLQKKFSWQADRVTHLLQTIAHVATMVKPQTKLHLLKDEPDNRILECAQTAKADYIVTGDKHLLALKIYEGAQMISLADFINLLLK